MSFNDPFLMLDVRSIRALIFSFKLSTEHRLAHGMEVRKPKLRLIFVTFVRGRVINQVTRFLHRRSSWYCRKLPSTHPITWLAGTLKAQMRNTHITACWGQLLLVNSQLCTNFQGRVFGLNRKQQYLATSLPPKKQGEEGDWRHPFVSTPSRIPGIPSRRDPSRIPSQSSLEAMRGSYIRVELPRWTLRMKSRSTREAAGKLFMVLQAETFTAFSSIPLV